MEHNKQRRLPDRTITVKKRPILQLSEHKLPTALVCLLFQSSSRSFLALISFLPILPNIELHCLPFARINGLFKVSLPAASSAYNVCPVKSSKIKLLAFLSERGIPLTHAKRFEIMIYILPVTLWCGIHLMHDANMRKLLFCAVPPVPSSAVRRTQGEGV